MNKRPFSVTLTSVFILLNATIWFGLGIIIAVNARLAIPVPPSLKLIMAILSVAMAGILALLFVFLHKGKRIAYYLTIAAFGFVTLLTIFDDVGLSDIIVLGLNLIPIVLLIKDRKWYLTTGSQAKISV